jgi:putative PIN family toxin of toxin-antitoxin system
VKFALDTNVFVSGVFFTGPPYQILSAWRNQEITLLVSPEIIVEYQRIGRELRSKFPGVDLRSFLELLSVHAEMIQPRPLPPVIHEDPSDDKFLECAVAGKAAFIVTGDKHLLRLGGFRGIKILKPREFVRDHLKK